jgi:hypothetical protein
LLTLLLKHKIYIKKSGSDFSDGSSHDVVFSLFYDDQTIVELCLAWFLAFVVEIAKWGALVHGKGQRSKIGERNSRVIDDVM